MLFVFFLSGCMDQMLYEEVGFILQIGLELDSEGNFVYSITYPITSRDTEEKVGFLSIKNEKLMRSSKEELRDRSGKKLVGGKTQHVYYSNELAQQGMSEFLEIFLRNSDNPMLANVVIVDGSPKEMMEFSLDYKDKPIISSYMNDMLKDGRDIAIASEQRLYTITILDYAKTIDPYIPILKYDRKGIEIKGSALLDGDRMVGEINKEQTILLNLMTGEKKNGRYILNQSVPDESISDIRQGAAFIITSAKSRINVYAGNEEKPRADIELMIKLRVEEFAGPLYLEDDKMKKKLEELLTGSIQSECLEIIKILQNTGSDPLGIEEKVRVKYNEIWKTMNWAEQYKEMQISVNIRVTVESYGVLD